MMDFQISVNVSVLSALVKQVNNSDTSHNNIPNIEWQLLGERELPFAENIDSVINIWLLEGFHLLNLHEHFLNRLLKSAQDAVARARNPNNIFKSQHLHFRVFAPKNQLANVQTWGFFRIEKMGTFLEGGNPDDHSIEFYLYPEG